MKTAKLLATLIGISLFSLCHASDIAKFGEDKTPYPLYAVTFGLDHQFSDTDIELLADHFDGLFGGISVPPETAAKLRGKRPDFDILRYYGGWNLDRNAFSSIAESKLQREVLHYHYADLANSIDSTTTRIPFKDAFGSIKIFEQHADAYAWILVDSELMRLVGIEGGDLLVERGWDSKAISHKPGTSIVAPVLGTRQPIQSPNLRLRHDDASMLRWNSILNSMLRNHRDYQAGTWIDILIGNFAKYTLGQERVDLESGRLWDRYRNQPITPKAITAYVEAGVNGLQTRFYAATGEWPLLWANNMQFPIDKSDSRLPMLLSSDIKPRPLDGFAQENSYAHWGPGGESGKVFQYTPYEEWLQSLQSIMYMGELKTAARPLMFDGGIDNLKFARLSYQRRTHLIEYGYASYLLAVKVEDDGSIYTKIGSCIMEAVPGTDGQKESAKVTLYPCFTWPIGKPVETRASADFMGYALSDKKVFVRRFENGIAIVNPQPDREETVDLISLGGPFYDPSADQRSADSPFQLSPPDGNTRQSITLSPRTGAILLKR